MKKRVLSLLLALVMCLSMAACGSEPSAPAAEPTAAPSAAPEPAATPEPTPEPEPEPTPEPEPERSFTVAGIGETVTLDGIDIELTTSDFTSGDKLAGNITVSTHSDSNKYFWLSGTMMNVGTETIKTWFDAMVNFVFDDTYTYEGSFHMSNDIGPFAETEIYFWADVPPAMLERYETVKVQFAYNDGFADYDWEAANYEKTMEGYDNQYEFVFGGGAGAAEPEEGSDTAPDTKGLWSVDYYVDDFQQPTEDWYITNSINFSGTFSNSATTNSKLVVQVAADEFEGERRVAFFLYEYGRNQVKNSSSSYVDEYDITMRDADGNDTSLSGTVYCGGDRLFIDDQYVDTVLEAMSGEGTLSFHIVDTERTTTTYLFSFETDNFGSLYAETVG